MKPKHLRIETQHQRIARLMLLGWSAERIARKLHCHTRTITRAISTAEFQTLYAQLQRDHLGRVDRHMSALLTGAVEALERMLSNKDWKCREAAVAHILRIHGRFIDRIDLTGQIQHAHDHQGRFTGEVLGTLPDDVMTDEMRAKVRELMEITRKMRQPRILPARLSDTNGTRGHGEDEETR
jgi:hypothetical protein